MCFLPLPAMAEINLRQHEQVALITWVKADSFKSCKKIKATVDSVLKGVQCEHIAAILRVKSNIQEHLSTVSWVGLEHSPT